MMTIHSIEMSIRMGLLPLRMLFLRLLVDDDNGSMDGADPKVGIGIVIDFVIHSRERLRIFATSNK